MDLATGAMGSLLLKLGGLLTDEYKLQAGVKEDVQYLKRELTSMYAALRKVGDVPRDELDVQVQLWADDVRDLSYRMEDVVDKFLVRVEGPKASSAAADKPRKLKRLMEKMGDLFTKGRTRHQIADEVKGIKARVQEAADRRDRYKVHDVVASPAGSATVDPRLMSLYKDRKELVGIDEPLSNLTEMLTEGDTDVSRQLKIVSIVGFGGLGKTSLAKAVYDKLQWQFDCSAFVPVGLKSSVKKLLNDILFEIDKQKHQDSILSSWDERQLIDQLRRSLATKRYFIVIDDMWDTEAWEIIRCALVDNNCASRIVTTTRILEVATKTGEVYKLKPLSHDLAEELFHTRLFGGKNKGACHQPAEVYEKMLHKCGGAPLAIITMASLLVGKPVEFWSKVYNSIGFGNEDNKDVHNTRKILLFSYYDLPCYLRTCLLYMSIYPEEHLIEKDSLIWKWVAEGFIHEEAGVGLYEIGERYFNELINKSMIQPVDSHPYDRTITGYYDIITGCRIHDMVLDMICRLAKEENFVTALYNNEQQAYTVHDNVRRLAVGDKNCLANTCMPQVRSFNVLSTDVKLPSLSCFQVLRVLALEGDTSSEHDTTCLEHLGKLVHLRYLGLRNINISELPKEIGDLKFLQMLEMKDCNKLLKLPQSIGQLSQLKCLRVYADRFSMLQCLEDTALDWIRNLTSLEELCLLNVSESSNFVNDLGKLTELRKLCIVSLRLKSASLIKDWEESLAKLQKIQVIDIGWFIYKEEGDATYCREGYVPPRQLRVLHMQYKQPGLPIKISPSLQPNLSHLSLQVNVLDVEIFGRFPELVTLQLDVNTYHYDVTGAPGAFPKLRAFKTDGTPRFLGLGESPYASESRNSSMVQLQ
ncbi:hypothetical protein CFC21_055621 [Triticum aestivum]|uniref:Uncharacterized protein n=2 Tax=Triticum aestivum TaxID=4565 RepID=A0A3B6I666_WHEAT|nr:hypothetical protein CFC21_055621 [Triticum aestivum]